MRVLRQRRPSPAMVVALLALFVALGGTAFSALRIDSSEVVNNSLRSVDLKNRKGVKTQDVRNGNLRGLDIADGSLGTAEIADGAVNSAKVADGSLAGGDLADNSLRGTQIDEGTLGQVPSADSATSATTVGGLSVKKISYATEGVSGAQEILSLGGLQLTASCGAGGSDIDLNASTTKNGASVFIVGIDAFSADDTDANRDLAAGGDEGGGFNIGDSEDVDGQAGNLDGNADSAFIQYFHPDGTAVTVDLVMDENPGCQAHGMAVGG